jgi:phosphoglycerate kinase
MKLRQINAEEFQGKNVLVRVDFNVPMKEGRVTDDTRIRAHLETLRLLKDAGAKTALVSHLGRPKGKKDLSFSLRPVAEYFRKLTGWDVAFCDDCVGDAVQGAMAQCSRGSFVVLENVRFYSEEEKNDEEFARNLAVPFDAFVMDAFSAAHRAHASTRGVAEVLPSYPGKLLLKEVEFLGEVRDAPRQPFVLVLGGAKVSDKIGVIEHLLDKVSSIVIGGGMAFTFLKAMGKNIGNSLCEEDKLAFSEEMLTLAQKKGIAIHLPVDVLVAKECKAEAPVSPVSVDAIPSGEMGLDIGPETCESFAKILTRAKTILWNGPMGVFELPPFAAGTRAVCEAMVEATRKGALTVIGGGDSAAAVNELGFAGKVSHISTGGGASLEFFEGKALPGVEPFIEHA